MNATKIKLSATELDLVTNADFILTKNRIICKVVDAFSFVASNFKNSITNKQLANEVLVSSPKIAKGENYLGLPWVMLDYPRVFDKQDTFAVRTFFWWGNYLSITLQLSGKYQQLYQQNIFKYLANTNVDWQLCCNKNAWQHHFEASNYKPFSEFSTKEFANLTFIKVAKKIPLQEWDKINVFLEENFTLFLNLLTT